MASGRLGRPEVGDDILFTVRFRSFWDRTTISLPVAVIYQNGTVAVPDSRTKVAKRPIDPMLPWTGGAFSECALQELQRDFDALTRADFGIPRMVYDAAEATITRFEGSAGGGEDVANLNALGAPFGGLTTAQNAARQRAEAWIEQVRQVAQGVPLLNDRVVMLGYDKPGAYPADLPAAAAVPWQGPSPGVPLVCQTLTGTSARLALASVRDSYRRVRFTGNVDSSYSGVFVAGGKSRWIELHTLPPGYGCGPRR